MRQCCILRRWENKDKMNRTDTENTESICALCVFVIDLSFFNQDGIFNNYAIEQYGSLKDFSGIRVLCRDSTTWL